MVSGEQMQEEEETRGPQSPSGHAPKGPVIIKTNEVLKYSKTGGTSGNIILSERNQIQSHILHDTFYIKYPEEANLQRQKTDCRQPSVAGGGKW